MNIPTRRLPVFVVALIGVTGWFSPALAIDAAQIVITKDVSPDHPADPAFQFTVTSPTLTGFNYNIGFNGFPGLGDGDQETVPVRDGERYRVTEILDAQYPLFNILVSGGATNVVANPIAGYVEFDLPTPSTANVTFVNAPEPATMAMMAIGTLVLLKPRVSRRKR